LPQINPVKVRTTVIPININKMWKLFLATPGLKQFKSTRNLYLPEGQNQYKAHTRYINVWQKTRLLGNLIDLEWSIWNQVTMKGLIKVN
jgi:hypothetical protein